MSDSGHVVSRPLDFATMAEEDFLDFAYRVVLRRPPDKEAVAAWSAAGVSRSALVRRLVESEEFERLRDVEDRVAGAAQARAHGEVLRSLSAPPTADERAIEIPWALSRYGGEPHVLDVGYAFADPVYLASLVSLGATEVVGVDLAESDVPGMETIAADLRQLPFPGLSFDVIFCVSTLEHVGRDNRVYGLADERDDEGISLALAELNRVLTPGGRLLLTVPCGEHEDHGWFVQQTVDAWVSLFTDADFEVVEQEIYERTTDGWRSVEMLNETGVRYGARGEGASAVLCAELGARTPRY